MRDADVIVGTVLTGGKRVVTHAAVAVEGVPNRLYCDKRKTVKPNDVDLGRGAGVTCEACKAKLRLELADTRG